MECSRIYIIVLVLCGSTVMPIFVDDRLCYHCTGEPSMARCNTFVTCQPEENCFVHTGPSASGPVFAAGCMPKPTCSVLAIHAANGNCLQCCETNLCGGDLCQTNTGAATHNITVMTSTATTTQLTTTTTASSTSPTTSVPAPIPCQDDPNIHCAAISFQVCGRDDHFTYLLCRKTCNGCAGPRFTLPPVAPVTAAPAPSTFQECYYHGHSTAYNGFVKVAVSGMVCEDWQNYALIFGYTDSMFPDGTMSLAKNNCRDPDNSGFPYCHTSRGIHRCALSECAGRCENNAHTNCRVVASVICPDDYVSRHLCPVTCNVCGYGLIPAPIDISTPGTVSTQSG